MRKELERPENYSDQLASLVGFINRACAFTGHRPKKLPWRSDETAPECAALKAALTEQIAALIEKGITHFMSGMRSVVAVTTPDRLHTLFDSRIAIALP